MGLSTTKEILTPGSKRRFLEQLDSLRTHAERDSDRDILQHVTAELLPFITNQFSYQLVTEPLFKRKPRPPHKCEGMIDPVRTKGVLR